MTVERPSVAKMPHGHWRQHATAVLATAESGKAYAVACATQGERKSCVAALWGYAKDAGLKLRSTYREGDSMVVLWCEKGSA